MKRVLSRFIFILGVTLAATQGYSQAGYKVKTYNMEVAGTSNLHDWTASVEKISGTLKVTAESGKALDIKDVELIFDAKSLKGSKGSIMDSKIKDALKSEKFPTIQFKLNQIENTSFQGGTSHIKATGLLTISGTNRPISLSTTGKLLPNGEIEITGSSKLKMSDFKIDPPTAMLGTLKTADEVTVTFKLVFQPSMWTTSK